MRGAVVVLGGLLVASACSSQHGAGTPPQLVVALPAGVASLLPFASNEEFSYSVLRNVYEPLVELDETLAARPGVARTWYTPDDTTWVFQLRDGVRLHDGRLLTATLVAQSLRQVLHDPRSRRAAELSAVDRIDTPDEATVVLHTSRPSSNLHNRLAGVLLSFPARAPDATPIGSGPYRITASRPGGSVALEAFAGYREGPPQIAGVEFLAVPSAEERVRMIESGQAHLVIDVPPSRFGSLHRTRGVRTVASPGLRTIYLGFDCVHDAHPEANPGGPNPFRDVRVRRAVSLALDRTRLTQGPLGGYGDPAHQIVPPEVFGHHPELPAWPNDPKEARRLLSEAGFPRGFAVVLDYPTTKYQAIDAVVGVVVADLGRAGIRVTPRPAPWTTFRDRVHTAHASAFYLAGWLNTTGDATGDYDYLVRTRAPTGAGLLNAGDYSSAEVDALLDKAMLPSTPVERLVPLLEVAERLHRDLPLVPLYRQRDLYAIHEKLGFEPRPDRRIRAEFMSWR